MAPGIGRSVGEGFRAALRSWPAIGLLIGGWLAVFLVAVLCFGVTNPPPELFEEAPAADVGGGSPGIGALPSEPAVVKPDAAVEEPALPLDDAGERQNRIVGQWLGRAWPMVLLCALLMLAANLWLSGGQIGYLVKQLQDGKSPLAEFWQAATHAFVPLLGATGLLAAASVALAVSVALLGMVSALLGGVLPALMVNLLGLLIGVALFVALVWLLVRAAAFWFIAVVADRLGPVAGLKAGFRTTRGRFWRILLLGVVVLLISWGCWLPFVLLEWAGTAMGGGAGGVLRLLSNLLGGLVSAFVGFAVSAAFIRFYLDARASP